MRLAFLSKTAVLAIIGVLLSVILVVFLVVQALPMFGYAQQAPVLQVACVPSNNQVATGEAVSYNAQVLSTEQGTVSYAWSGANIQTVNSPQITLSYATPGVKSATAIVTMGELTAQATCTVEVVETVTPSNLKVTCAPSKAEVGRDEPVVWRARVTGAKGNIVYRWSGVNITSKNEPAIKTSYGSVGTKRAVVKVTSGGETTEATCTVNVNGTTTNPNQNQTGQNQNQGQQFADILKNLLGGQQGGQQGSPLGGQQGGNNGPFGGTQGGQTTGGQQGGPVGSSRPGGTTGPQQIGGGQNNPSGDSPATRLSEEQTDTSGGGTKLNPEDCKPTTESTTSKPTTEYAVPVDTVSINEYIWKFVLKEAGDPMGGAGPEDAEAACKADELSKALAEAAGNWLMKSFGGNPAFIEDWVVLFADLKTIHFEKFVEEYKKNKQTTGAQAGQKQDVVLTNLEARENVIPLYAEKLPQSKSQNYWENYLAGAEGHGSNILRFLSANEELEAQQAGAAETEKLAQTINNGISDQLGDNGEILVPGSIAGTIAVTRILNPESRLAGGADEVGETLDSLQKHLESPSADWLRQQGELPA